MRSSIVSKGITVEFPIYETPNRSIKKAVLNLSSAGKIAHDANNHSIVTALSNLNFNFEEGAKVGLVGHNGSGKTTLLRVISGVYTPVRGEIKVHGNIASLMDMSMGMDPDATGYENIYLRGILEGLKPATIRSKITEIAEFSGLGNNLMHPVRTYSSGMMLRLGFSISTSIEADILIMDEWLSVGDQEFSSRATERLHKLVGNAAILVIASHDHNLIENICNRKITLQNGHIIADETI